MEIRFECRTVNRTEVYSSVEMKPSKKAFYYHKTLVHAHQLNKMVTASCAGTVHNVWRALSVRTSRVAYFDQGVECVPEIFPKQIHGMSSNVVTLKIHILLVIVRQFLFM